MQNYPSIKTISRIKTTTKESAKLARIIIKADNRESLENLSIYDDYYQKIGKYMYNPHSLTELKMQLLNLALDGYGVESFETDNMGYCDYINFGDTYDLTVCFFNYRFMVCSWGDIAERYIKFVD